MRDPNKKHHLYENLDAQGIEPNAGGLKVRIGDEPSHLYQNLDTQGLEDDQKLIGDDFSHSPLQCESLDPPQQDFSLLTTKEILTSSPIEGQSFTLQGIGIGDGGLTYASPIDGGRGTSKTETLTPQAFGIGDEFLT